MEEEQTQGEVRLGPGVTPFHDGRWGLRLGEERHYARGEPQGAIVWLLARGRRRPEDIIAALGGSGPGALTESMASLALAEFILEFADYLEK